MGITVAKGSGFCFGVRRAFKILEEQIANAKSGDIIVTLGQFVHNPQIVEELKNRGVPPITNEQLEEYYAKAKENQRVTVVLRTHGISKQLFKRLTEYKEQNP